MSFRSLFIRYPKSCLSRFLYKLPHVDYISLQFAADVQTKVCVIRIHCCSSTAVCCSGSKVMYTERRGLAGSMLYAAAPATGIN
jgi:hypothetical protein